MQRLPRWDLQPHWYRLPLQVWRDRGHGWWAIRNDQRRCEWRLQWPAWSVVRVLLSVRRVPIQPTSVDPPCGWHCLRGPQRRRPRRQPLGLGNRRWRRRWWRRSRCVRLCRRQQSLRWSQHVHGRSRWRGRLHRIVRQFWRKRVVCWRAAWWARHLQESKR